MRTVVETPPYLADAERLGLSEAKQKEIVTMVADDPEVGDMMQGTGGCRKFRFAGRGKGKSGGYRIITFPGGDHLPAFLLAIFGKDEKANLSKGERNDLAKLVKVLVETYHNKIVRIGGKK